LSEPEDSRQENREQEYDPAGISAAPALSRLPASGNIVRSTREVLQSLPTPVKKYGSLAAYTLADYAFLLLLNFVSTDISNPIIHSGVMLFHDGLVAASIFVIGFKFLGMLGIDAVRNEEGRA
jgi:hypothetical protein